MRKASRDYEQVARAIWFVTENAFNQPTLEDVATHVGLSKFHFQRMFRRLAGVSPKQFLQALTAIHARRLLKESASVSETALKVGLSGPGRLHDLTVTLEGMTPGEVKSGGQGLSIRAGFADTPFGRCLVSRTYHGICGLSFVEIGECEDEAFQNIESEWPNANILRDDLIADNIVNMVFGRNKSRMLTLHVRGTNFQVKVWRAILSIPSGHVVSYGKVASAVHSKKSARAIGTALAKNPIAVLIPCHRVIRETGIIGDYKWGTRRKQALLAWEAAGRLLKNAPELAKFGENRKPRFSSFRAEKVHGWTFSAPC